MSDNLRNALETICGLANAHLENRDRRADTWISLTSLVDNNGTASQGARDKIVMCVHSITRETAISTYASPASTNNANGLPGSLAVGSPPLFIDVHLMFMANFTDYAVGLAALSRLISYFQQTPVFDRTNAPSLAPGMDKLALEFENLGPVEVHHIISMLGTCYLPSVFYRLRMIPFVSSAMAERPQLAAGVGGRVVGG